MVVKRTNKIPSFKDFVDFSSGLNNSNGPTFPDSGSGNNSVINKKNPIPTPQNQNQNQTPVQIISFQHVFIENDWQEDTTNNNFTYTIDGSIHGKGSNLVYDVFELNNGLQKVILEGFKIDTNDNITLVSGVPFDGKIIIK